MADIKTLQTRIALKYDSYSKWTDESKEGQGANLVLLAGEIGFCEIPTGNSAATTAPTVLFKVGDGTTPFKNLKWASALAADVYDWAKASDVVLEGKTIKFVSGTGENRKVIKEVAIPYVTDAEVKAITDPLAARISAVESALGVDSGAEDSVTSRLDSAEAKLDDILGHEASEGVEAKTGLIDQALIDAKAYTDEREVEINKYADKAEEDAIAAAKAYADGIVTEQAKTDGAQDALIAANKAAIEKEVEDRAKADEDVTKAFQEADKEINDKIGGSFDSTNTVAKAITDAIDTAAATAQSKVDALANSTVKKNTEDIAQNKADIAQLRTDLEAEATTRGEVDADHEGRIAAMEAFFEGAARDEGEGENLKQALDTLKEIQDFATGEGTAATEMLDAIDKNAKAIKAVEDIVKDGGTLEVRVDEAEAAISAIDGRVTDLEGRADDLEADSHTHANKAELDKIADGDVAKWTEAYDKRHEHANKAELDKFADGDKAKLDTAAQNAAQAVADLSALTGKDGRIETAEKAIDALEAIVVEGDNTNAKLRTDISELQGIVKTGADANATLRTDLTNLKNTVENTTTGLAATKKIADDAKTKAEDAQSRVAAVEADYLKAADLFIINCGSSTEVIHNA